MRRVCLCLLAVLVLASSSYGYTWKGKAAPKRSESSRQFTGSKSLYDDYSGWVIPLRERWGTAPLAALSSAKNVEEVIPVVYLYAGEFMDLFDSIDGNMTEKTRAEISLELLLAFCITDEEQEADFRRELRSLMLKDKEIPRQGAEANYYARKITASKSMPLNFLHELKQDNPNEYKALLYKFSGADYETLKACAEYPNATAFLLNTGRKGVDLLEKTEGQVITLSWFLDPEHQKNLPEQFMTYPRLSEAVKYCGADAYFTIMACPELFFQLVALLRGSMSGRYSMAYAVMLCQIGEGNERARFLQGLSRSEAQRLAGYAAELMNLPDNEEYFGSSLAPIREPLFLQFSERYGELAVEACRKYSAVVDVSDLFMNEWDGWRLDVTPVLRALDDYDDAGLQAALFFRHMKTHQDFVLNFNNAFDRETLLMFMFYDETSEHHYTQGIGSMSDGAKYMLAKFTPAEDTGLPAKNQSDNGWLEYVPLHSAGVMVVNYFRYGRVPPAGELAMTAFGTANDVATLIPIVAATYGLLAKSSGKIIISNARKAIVKTVTSPINTAKDTLTRIVKSAKNMTLDEIKDELLAVIQGTGQRSIETVSELSLPSWDNFSDFVNFITSKQLDSIPIVNLLKYPDKVQKLYSKPWLTKRATEFLVNKTAETIEDIARNKLINHAGIKAIINQLAY